MKRGIISLMVILSVFMGIYSGPAFAESKILKPVNKEILSLKGPKKQPKVGKAALTLDKFFKNEIPVKYENDKDINIINICNKKSYIEENKKIYEREKMNFVESKAWVPYDNDNGVKLWDSILRIRKSNYEDRYNYYIGKWENARCGSIKDAKKEIFEKLYPKEMVEHTDFKKEIRELPLNRLKKYLEK